MVLLKSLVSDISPPETFKCDLRDSSYKGKTWKAKDYHLKPLNPNIIILTCSLNESLEEDVNTATTLFDSSFAPNTLKDSDIFIIIINLRCNRSIV